MDCTRIITPPVRNVWYRYLMNESGITSGGGESDAHSAGNRSKKHDALIARLLSDPNKQEALSFLNTTDAKEQRTVAGYNSNRESIAFIEGLYALGAVEIMAIGIHPTGPAMDYRQEN